MSNVIKNADLTSLRDGTMFHVVNGDWDGIIRYISGDCHLLNDSGTFRVTSSNNRLLDIIITGTEDSFISRLDSLIKKIDDNLTGVPY